MVAARMSTISGAILVLTGCAAGGGFGLANTCTTSGPLVREVGDFVQEEIFKKDIWQAPLQDNFHATTATTPHLIADPAMCHSLAKELEAHDQPASTLAVLQLGDGYVARAISGDRRAYAIFDSHLKWFGGAFPQP